MEPHLPGDSPSIRLSRSFDPGLLSPSERIALADLLYDSAMQEIEAVTLSPQDMAELDRRLTDIDAGMATLVPWDDAFAQIAASLRP